MGAAVPQRCQKEAQDSPPQEMLLLHSQYWGPCLTSSKPSVWGPKKQVWPCHAPESLCICLSTVQSLQSTSAAHSQLPSLQLCTIGKRLLQIVHHINHKTCHWSAMNEVIALTAGLFIRHPFPMCLPFPDIICRVRVLHLWFLQCTITNHCIRLFSSRSEWCFLV